MKTSFHKGSGRGFAQLDWLQSHHSFSFASYYDPERMGFGQLRVLNDDVIAPGTGFDTHPHRDMEIVSIPLSGGLKHEDTEGNRHIIREGEVQLMSAGSGIAHSEYNASLKEASNFLQIWILPRKLSVAPSYQQREFRESAQEKGFQLVVAPDDQPHQSDALLINQDAYFSLGRLPSGDQLSYTLHSPRHGVYVFVIEGAVEVAGHKLSRRDGLGIEDATQIEFSASEDSRLLVIETIL